MLDVKDLARRHPSQRLAAPSQGFSALFHSLGVACNLYSLQYLARHPNRISQAFGGHLQYFTVIGLSLTFATLLTGLLSDLFLSRRLFRLKNFLSIVGAPVEFQITVFYWGIRAWNADMVAAPDVPALPFWSDVTFHLAPLLFLTTDLLLFSPPYAVAALPAYGLSAVTAVVYFLWLDVCRARNGFYSYPLFDEFSTTVRVVVFAASALVMGTATAILKSVYVAVNGRAMDETTRPRPKENKKLR